MGLLAKHYEQGRRFEVRELVERGDSVAVGLTVSQPDWSGSADIFKVFTFRPTDDKVISMQDCHSRDEALAALTAM